MEDISWKGAVDLCERENGYLAEIPNIYVNNILTDLLDEGDRCWIGLSKYKNIDYDWRIGNFSLGELGMLKNYITCGAIDTRTRWKFDECESNNTCTYCMKGKLKFLLIF